MRIDEGLDTGDILLQRELPIAPDQTSADLFPLLAEQGAGLMVETLAGLQAGTIVPQKQDDSQSTLAPILTREDARIDFSRTAAEIYNRWRGFRPWPGAYILLSEKKLSIHRLLPHQLEQKCQPGELLIDAGRFFVACGHQSWIELLEVQMEGKKRMAAADFLRGAQLKSGQLLS
jgi:methionyl-tRNA formyltransferase